MGISRDEEVPQVPRSWNTLGQSSFHKLSFNYPSVSSHLLLTNVLLFSGKRCKKLPVLTDLKERRSRKVFKKIGPRGFFLVKVVLSSRAYRRCFTLGHKKMASSDRDNAKDKPTDGAARVAGDEGESHHSRDEHP